MQPQFVDFNGNGHIDIVTATFDGSPWVAFGSDDGLRQPQHLLDKNGNRIILSRHYDRTQRQWTSHDRTGGKAPDAHCISAVAFDWNGNGVHDLILGDRNGRLFLQLNEGTNSQPKFAGVSTQLEAGGEPLHVESRITAPRMVDWDGDGLLDIVVGTFGDTWGTNTGGAVLWFRNVGETGAPVLEQARVLIEHSRKAGDGPTRPDAGLYIDVVDYNGNGRLDIVVGGYSIWPSEGTNPRRRPNREPYVWVYLQRAEEGEEPQEDPAVER
jgi:hypothetical protein